MATKKLINSKELSKWLKIDVEKIEALADKHVLSYYDLDGEKLFYKNNAKLEYRKYIHNNFIPAHANGGKVSKAKAATKKKEVTKREDEYCVHKLPNGTQLEIHRDGKIYANGELVKPCKEHGRLVYRYKDENNIQRYVTLARLVANYFVKNHHGYHFVCYKNGDKTNIAADNLCYTDCPKKYYGKR